MCDFNKFILVEKPYCVAKWLPGIAGMDPKRTFVVAIIQCEKCSHLELFNAINYTSDDTDYT